MKNWADRKGDILAIDTKMLRLRNLELFFLEIFGIRKLTKFAKCTSICTTPHSQK